MKRIAKILKVFLFIVLGLIILFSISSTIYNRIGNCKVEGEINGLGTHIAIVSGGSKSYDQKYVKLILVFNDKFSFKANLDGPGGGRIITWNMFFKRASGWPPLGMRSRIIGFSINPNETIVIKGSINDYSINYLISGNKKAEQSSKFTQDNLNILERETKLYLKIDSMQFHGKDKNSIDSLNKIFDETRAEFNYQRLKYVIQNPDHEISARFLQSQKKDTIIKYFPLLSENVLKTYNGKILKERFIAYRNIEVGKLAPGISGLTIDSKLFNLNDLKGKYVVLDFWGTWCGWCIKGFPKMQEYYDKNKNELEFVGIACRDSKKSWEIFLADNDLKWIQLLNDKENNDLSIKYGVEGYPTKVIIDKEGRIVEIFSGESNEFYNKLDELLKQ